jgi:pimeloyl-ACP methyl ester carboxylesterase
VEGIALARSAATLAVAVVVAAAAAGGGTAGANWDRCTPRQGDLRFRAADGTRLVGHRFGSGRVAVVLAHESRGWLCEWVPYAKRLAARGYLAFPFDFRGYGESQSNSPSSVRIDLDVAAAAKTVRGLGANKVFLVGASIGGSAVLRAGADTRPLVNGVVSVSGGADLVDAIAAVKRLRVPALFVAGRFDPGFAPDARRLYTATASKDKKLAIVARGEHGSRLVEADASVRATIEEFLRSH